MSTIYGSLKAFDNALMGRAVWVTTTEKIAHALGVELGEVIK